MRLQDFIALSLACMFLLSSIAPVSLSEQGLTTGDASSGQSQPENSIIYPPEGFEKPIAGGFFGANPKFTWVRYEKPAGDNVYLIYIDPDFEGNGGKRILINDEEITWRGYNEVELDNRKPIEIIVEYDNVTKRFEIPTEFKSIYVGLYILPPKYASASVMGYLSIEPEENVYFEGSIPSSWKVENDRFVRENVVKYLIKFTFSGSL